MTPQEVQGGAAGGGSTAAEAALIDEEPHLSIVPEFGWAPLDLREIWQYRDLLVTLAIRDLKLRYRQTALGVGWVVLQPLLAAGVFSFVFGKVAGLKSGHVPYMVFSYAGLLGWNLFAGILQRTSISLIANNQLISKVYFPRLTIPLSIIGSVMVDFSVAVFLMGVLMIVYHITPLVTLALVPLWILILLSISMGAGLIASALAVTYRDIQYIIPVFLQILLYASPVAYSVAAVPAQYRWVYMLNPLTPPLEAMRVSILGGGVPAWPALGISAGLGVVILLIGLYSFKRMERRFADVI